MPTRDGSMRDRVTHAARSRGGRYRPALPPANCGLGPFGLTGIRATTCICFPSTDGRADRKRRRVVRSPSVAKAGFRPGSNLPIRGGRPIPWDFISTAHAKPWHLMNRVLETDPVVRTACVEPSVVKDQLNRERAKHGSFFAAVLSAPNRVTIGGMISTDDCSQGTCLYGKTRDHVPGVVSSSTYSNRDGGYQSNSVSSFAPNHLSGDRIVPFREQTWIVHRPVARTILDRDTSIGQLGGRIRVERPPVRSRQRPWHADAGMKFPRLKAGNAMLSVPHRNTRIFQRFKPPSKRDEDW